MMFGSGKKKYSKIKAQVIVAMLERAKTLPAEEMTSVRALFRDVFEDSVEISERELFDLSFALSEQSEKAGLFFDSSALWRIPTGQPQDCPFYVRPLKPHVAFDFIRYTESSWPNFPEKLTINLRKKEICSASEVTRGAELYYLCTSDQWAETIDLVESCSLDQWEAKYYRPVLDGMSWEIALLKEGKVQRKITGDNDYPDAWRIFWALKQHCLRLIRREAFCHDRPEICPFCASTDTRQYVFGGREVSSHDPKWECAECGAKFFEGDSFLINEWDMYNQ